MSSVSNNPHLESRLSAIETSAILAATIIPEYEYYNYWAEESGNSSDNNFQWSWGNGDSGVIGLPVGDGVEIIAVAFHADNGGSAGEDIQIRTVDIQNINSLVTLHTLDVVAAGQGQDNNAHLYQDLRANPVVVPDGGVLSFETGVENGIYNGMRCGIWTRQLTGRQFLTV